MISPTPARVVRLSAVSVSRRVAPLFARAARGSVLATFTRSAYVEIEDRLVVLADEQLLDGPLNILLSTQEPGVFDSLGPGLPAIIRNRTLDLGGRWEIDLRQARLWDPRLVPIAEIDGGRWFTSALEAMAAMLDAEAPEESLARPRARPPRAERGMTYLAYALRTQASSPAAQLARRAAEELAGLGPGLTPSGDDVLAGAMIALTLGDPARAPLLAGEIAAAARGRTTRISQAYLEAAAAGEAGEAWHRLAAVLGAAQSAESANLDDAARRIMAFGETSGSDMLAGLVLGMTELLRHPPRSTG